jgi:serine/threonine-protein kinase
MATDQTSPLLERLRQSDLLEADQLEEVAALPESRDPDPRVLGRWLLRSGWLTRFQINQVGQGRGKDLSIGPYVLLDLLGEGGMGQVFKARHRHMQRIVALKVIRKERLASEAAVKRFYQEAQAAAQLQHPNIAIAYDAGPAGNTHYFAMEYVDGQDLSRLVRDSGPLPAALACEYVRQAALGLQHAHERGLVHRDVKPANLLVSGADPEAAVVKVLDLGLARLQGLGEKALTQSGQVLGTPEYLAPEQALDARSADGRSDLYSLGCTLHFLLTGRPPFGGESLAQVLLQHQIAEPEVPAGGWGDVPAGVQAIVRKLLAKKPEDRIQTPAELAEALAPFCGATKADAPPSALALAKVPSDSVWQTLTAGSNGGSSSRAGARRQAADSSGSGSSAGRTYSFVRSKRRQIAVAATVLAIGGLSLAFLVVVLLLTRSKPSDQAASATSAPVPLAKAPPPDTLPTVGGPGMPEKRPPSTTAVPRPSQRSRAPDPSPPPAVPAKPSANDINAGIQAQRPAPRALAPAEADLAKLPPNKSPQVKTAPLAGNEDLDPIAVAAQGTVPLLHPARIIKAGAKHFARVGISPDGKYGWYTAETSALVDLASGKELSFSPGRGYATNAFSFTPDSSKFLVFTSDRALRLWSIADGALVRTFDCNDHPWVQDLVISSDGKHAAAARGTPWFNPDGTREMRDCGVSVWDIATGREVRAWDWPEQPVSRVAFSLDGNRVFAKCLLERQSSIGVFDVGTGEALPKLKGPTTGFGMTGIVLAPDGRNLLITAYPGVVLWDTKRAMELRQFAHGLGARCVATCDRYIITGGGAQVPNRMEWENCDVRVRDANTGRTVFSLEGHSRIVLSVAVSADGRSILSGDLDGNVLYWKLPR